MQFQARLVFLALLVLGGTALPLVQAQEAAATGVVVEDVLIFDGTGAGLSGPSHVLVAGESIKTIAGGPSFALRRAIDEGLVAGPRIYSSGAMITITSGHGDFRSRNDLPREAGGHLTIAEVLSASQLADSPDEVRMRTREQLLLDASQSKLTAGGGVAAPHSPLDVSTFTEDELRAAVQAAANWGTYVGVHAVRPTRSSVLLQPASKSSSTVT